VSLKLLDTTVLSNFAHCRRPDLLQRALGEHVATTPTVLAELRAGEALGLVPACDWSWVSVLEPTTEERTLAAGLARQLDPGEAECLAVAQVKRCVFLSDDLAARRLASQRGIMVSGTLGTLLMLVERKDLSVGEVDALLGDMIDRGYRSPVASLAELL